MFSVHLLNDKTRLAKGWGVAVAKDVRAFEKAITEFCWSPIMWRGGVRKKDNFEKAFFAVLDFDSGMTIEQAQHNYFADYDYIIGTTKSHGVLGDRFRVVLRLEKPITSAEVWEATHRHLVQQFDADKACVDAARWYYPCKEIVAKSFDRTGYMVTPMKPISRQITESVHYTANYRFFVEYLRRPPVKGKSQVGRTDSTFIFAKECCTMGIGEPGCIGLVIASGILTNDFTLSDAKRQIHHAYGR